VESNIYIPREDYSMKKLLSLAVLLLLMFTVACGQTDEKTNDKAEDSTQGEKTVNKEDEKKALVMFEMELADILHLQGAAIADLAAAKADYTSPEVAEADKPTQEDLETLKTEAQKAASEMATAVSSLTIPSGLSEESQATLETAVENFVKGMEWNAENIPALPTEEPTEGENLIAEFDKAINDLHIKLGLMEVKNFSNEMY
jgi:hypothetical protein